MPVVKQVEDAYDEGEYYEEEGEEEEETTRQP